ncbi:9217_t:CDS:2 [Diversispora eburnea]|uniref:9217_t:CDS:1 n=1 Tax=Diversispora eburnea TaxID=1213867 RepID=A0A9N9F1T8_9GLOM|nr:9217_t:CDS:2 [Diversispora eburnea]
MGALHYKIGRLRSLWQEFRITNDGDQSEWTRVFVKELNSEYQVPPIEYPKELFETLQETIKNRENNLNTPAEERIQDCDDNMDEEYLKKLNLEF